MTLLLIGISTLHYTQFGVHFDLFEDPPLLWYACGSAIQRLVREQLAAPSRQHLLPALPLPLSTSAPSPCLEAVVGCQTSQRASHQSILRSSIVSRTNSDIWLDGLRLLLLVACCLRSGPPPLLYHAHYLHLDFKPFPNCSPTASRQPSTVHNPS